MMNLKLVKTGFHFASQRSKWVLLLSTFGFTGYWCQTKFPISDSLFAKLKRIQAVFRESPSFGVKRRPLWVRLKLEIWA
jgi:hypothetical protein